MSNLVLFSLYFAIYLFRSGMPAKNNTNLGLAPCFQANTLFRDRLIFVY